MKSYTIRQQHQPVPDPSIAVKTDIPVKKWKLFFAVVVLIGAAFLIIKLQQLESNRPVIAVIGNKPAAATTPARVKDKITSIKKEAVLKKNIVNPVTYLKIKTNWHKNLIGETVIEGTVNNTAPLVNFKDPVLLITWLSKTNTVLGTHHHPIYEYLGAGNSIRYKLKLKAPSKIGDVKVSIESAKISQ